MRLTSLLRFCMHKIAFGSSTFRYNRAEDRFENLEGQLVT